MVLALLPPTVRATGSGVVALVCRAIFGVPLRAPRMNEPLVTDWSKVSVVPALSWTVLFCRAN